MISKSPSSSKIVLIHNEYHGLPQWLSSKESACNAGPAGDLWVENRSLGREDSLEEVMAAHSSILASRIPWIKETRGLQSIGWQRVRYNWSGLAHKHAVRYHNNKWFDPKHNPPKGKKKKVFYIWIRNTEAFRKRESKGCYHIPPWGLLKMKGLIICTRDISNCKIIYIFLNNPISILKNLNGSKLY